MDIFLKEVRVGQISIELSIQETEGCTVIFTVKNVNNEILWKTHLLGEDGKPKVYRSVDEAFLDAQFRLKIYNHDGKPSIQV